MTLSHRPETDTATWRRLLALTVLLGGSAVCGAHGLAGGPSLPVPAALQVQGPLPAVAGVTDLKFRDLYRLPVGPRGLEPNPRLVALEGQRVRIVGYMVRDEGGLGPAGLVRLAPLPVDVGGEDESFADDVPATIVYAHLDGSVAHRPVIHRQGLMALTGTLQLGGRDEADGRRSMVRLLLDEPTSLSLTEPVASARALMQQWMEQPHAVFP